MKKRNSQSKNNEPIYGCKNCCERVSEADKNCQKCGNDLSKVGRHISLTFTEFLRLSDSEKKKILAEDIKWDSDTLALLGVAIAIFLGLISIIISTTWLSITVASLISFFATLFAFILITKVKLTKRLLLKFLTWLLKRNN